MAEKAARPQHQVWALAYLDEPSERGLRSFFASRTEVVSRRIRRDLHLSVYHARRPLPGVMASERSIDFTLPVSELRLMPMMPGGENPRDDIDPTTANIGLRVRRGAARSPIESLRGEFYPFETSHVLGRRAPSTAKASAFGARMFQPHITVLRAGGVTQRDLQPLGDALRSAMDTLRFDRFRIDVRSATLATNAR
jgi:hypothetical protein